jgi:hypothetical protein
MTKKYNIKKIDGPHYNRKFFIKEDYFNVIDTPEKAYFLGWIAADGHLQKRNSFFTVALQISDIEILEKLRGSLSASEPKRPLRTRKYEKGSDVIILTTSCTKMVKQLKTHLSIPLDIGAKDHIVQFPILDTDRLKWHFLRGLYEGDGTISSIHAKKKSLYVRITSKSDKMKQAIQNLFGQRTPKDITKDDIRWCGENAFQFLSKIYEDSDNLKLTRKHNRFLEWQEKINKGEYKFRGVDLTPNHYELIGPDGEIHIGESINNFAKLHHLHQWSLYKVLKGERKSHKGFKLFDNKVGKTTT